MHLPPLRLEQRAMLDSPILRLPATVGADGGAGKQREEPRCPRLEESKIDQVMNQEHRQPDED